MPVKRLETFSENIPGGTVDANLKVLIEQELHNTGDRPTIVVDGSAVRFLFSFKESKYTFQQPDVTKMKIENFFEKIISFGANVIVVLRGTRKSNPDKWFSEKKYSLLNEKKKYETLKEPEGICYKGVNSFTSFCCSQTLASISNEHYTAFTSIEKTTKEVANIADKKKCLAVLGQDSNYLIYEGIRFYISLKSLDTETFNCKFYDRNVLLKCLGLNSYQLPMFATLCGNDVISFYTLRSFHKRIAGPNYPDLLLCLAEKVKYTSQDPYGCIQEMVVLIAHKEITENLIKESLDLYLKSEQIQPGNELQNFALERVRKCDWNHKLYKIFVHKEYYSTELSNFCNVGLTVFEFLRPLREKLYGILFPVHGFCIKEYFLEEMLLHEYKSGIPKTVYKVSNREHPGLIELFENRSLEMNFSRWELFLSCVSETLSLSEVRIVPQNYLFPVMALHYLHVASGQYFRQKKIFKQDLKLEAFLLGVLLFEEFPREREEYTEVSKPDLWELQLTGLYMEVCFVLLLLNQACGFVISRQKACCCNFYDGKLTHWIYDKMQRGATCDEFFGNNIVLEALFYTLMDVIRTE